MVVTDKNITADNNENNRLYLNPAYSAWILLNRTRFAISRSRDIELSRIGLTPEQSAILQMLNNRNGKATVTQLSNAWLRQRHSVSTLVNRMQKQGLVTSIKYPKRKDLEIVMTEKGQNLVGKITIDSVDAVFSFLSAEDRQKLSQYLKLLLIRTLTLIDANTDLSQNEVINYKYYNATFSIWRLLDSTRFVIGRMRDLELARMGLTPEQSAILLMLKNRNGKATVTHFSNLWLRQRHSVSTLVNRMQKQGLVKTIKYPKHKELEIVISPEGADRYAQMTVAPIDRIFSFLSPEEVQKLSLYLNVLLGAARSLLGLDDIASLN